VGMLVSLPGKSYAKEQRDCGILQRIYTY
jgi:hypothetical protein